ncbi:MAG: hypothetical protein Kow0031_19440 [Anaerolineae bacterium]
MLSIWMWLNIPARLLAVLATGAAVAVLALPGPVDVDNAIKLYAGEQWEGRQILELSPAVQTALEQENPDVAYYQRQLARLRAVESDPALNMTYSEKERSDGWLVVSVSGTGQGFAKLNELFFGGAAQISASEFGGQELVRITQSNRNPGELTAVGGSENWTIVGQQVVQSNADQVQLYSIARWLNPFDLDIELNTVAGAPNGSLAAVPSALYGILPAEGAAEPPPLIPGLSTPVPTPAGVNVIRNGEFEIPWPDEELNGVAPEWEGYDNGRAHFGWYEEMWPEAVWEGERAQLMEIFEVEPNYYDRVMAIYQTVDVVPNSQYFLEMYAILRSDADPELRNKDDRQMHWGIDPLGEGNYDNVTEWVLMDLNEQNRFGSTAPYPEDRLLEYQRVTGTITTTNSSRITLFIRGLKKFPDNVEINMNIDNVRLVGPNNVVAAASKPAPTAVAVQVTPQPASPSQEDAALPSSGGVISRPASFGKVAIGGFVLIIIGVAATLGLLNHRKEF